MPASKKSARDEWKSATPAMRTATVLITVAILLVAIWFMPYAFHMGENAIH